MPNTECSSVSQSSAAFARQPRREQGLEGDVKEGEYENNWDKDDFEQRNELPSSPLSEPLSSSPPLILLPSFLLFEAPEPFGNAI